MQTNTQKQHLQLDSNHINTQQNQSTLRNNGNSNINMTNNHYHDNNNRPPIQPYTYTSKKKKQNRNSISKDTIKRSDTSTNSLINQNKFSIQSPISPVSMRNQPKKDIKQYEKIINQLKQENQELRLEIIELKVNQFYRFDQSKVKQLVTFAQNMKSQNRELKRKVQQSQIVRDFLERSNQKLKQQCQHLIKSLTNMKMEPIDHNFKVNKTSQFDPNQFFKKTKYNRGDFRSPIGSTRRRQTTYTKQIKKFNDIFQQNADSDPNPDINHDIKSQKSVNKINNNIHKNDQSIQIKQQQLSKISSGSFGGDKKYLQQSLYYSKNYQQY